jgi:hypothetical protein
MTYGEIIATIECYIYLITNQNVLIAMPRNVGEIKKDESYVWNSKTKC